MSQNQKQSVEGWKTNREKWLDFWMVESQHCEQKYLTADTHGIILDFLSQQQLEVVEKVKQMLTNWTDFTCHSRAEHEKEANDCPGWSHEDQYVRQTVISQILQSLSTLTTLNSK